MKACARGNVRETPDDASSPESGDARSPADPRACERSMPVRLIGRLVLVLILDAVALLVLAWILPGLVIDTAWAALALAAVIGIANAVIWPLMLRIALPFTVATLGLGALVLNAALLLGAAAVLEDVHVHDLWTAIGVVLGLT